MDMLKSNAVHCLAGLSQFLFFLRYVHLFGSFLLIKYEPIVFSLSKASEASYNFDFLDIIILYVFIYHLYMIFIIILETMSDEI